MIVHPAAVVEKFVKIVFGEGVTTATTSHEDHKVILLALSLDEGYAYFVFVVIPSFVFTLQMNLSVVISVICG